MKKNERIIEVALPVPLRTYFDYALPLSIPSTAVVPGIRVLVPFGKKELIGIVVGYKTHSPISRTKLKCILEVIDTEVLFPPVLFRLIQWAAEYYHFSLGRALYEALPLGLRKGGSLSAPSELDSNNHKSGTASTQLNFDQQAAVETILNFKKNFKVFLLIGVTGSGKTEVYIHAVMEILRAEKQALILVPEIALTPQMVKRFEDYFGSIVSVYHSRLSHLTRLKVWSQVRSGNVKLIIATRSGIFLPFMNLGILIIDEEHDLSFKQQEGFRYSARDLAIRRAQLENIPIILGSATPSLESIYNVKAGRYHRLSLPQRIGEAGFPDIQLINMRNQTPQSGLSLSLIKEIKEHLVQGNQILLFLNRRGYAPSYLCQNCGWTAQCERCDAYFVLHLHPPSLRCHYCDSKAAIPSQCPVCHKDQFITQGLGTQQIEKRMQILFPGIPIIRIDRDNTRRKGKLEGYLETIDRGGPQILVGTQILTKGHNFLNVTCVGVLNVDEGLFSSDFRASERVAQRVMQVAGRAGRADKKGYVFIQTYRPEYPFFRELMIRGYVGFAEQALAERSSARLPPFYHLALIRAESISAVRARLFLDDIKNWMIKFKKEKIEYLGPAPAILQKRKGRYTEQLLLRTSDRVLLHQVIRRFVEKFENKPFSRSIHWSVDIDPQEM